MIEDARQAHGAALRGRGAGIFGDVAAFSFYPSKNLGAYGDAGGIITADDELADCIRLLRDFGQRKKHDHLVLGGSGQRVVRRLVIVTSIRLAAIIEVPRFTTQSID